MNNQESKFGPNLAYSLTKESTVRITESPARSPSKKPLKANEEPNSPFKREPNSPFKREPNSPFKRQNERASWPSKKGRKSKEEVGVPFCLFRDFSPN